MMEQMQKAFQIPRFVIEEWKQEKLKKLEKLVKFRSKLKQEKT